MTGSDWKGGSYSVRLSEDLNSSGDEYDKFMQIYFDQTWLTPERTAQVETEFDSRTTSGNGLGSGQYALGNWVECPQGSNPFNMP